MSYIAILLNVAQIDKCYLPSAQYKNEVSSTNISLSAFKALNVYKYHQTNLNNLLP